MFAYRTVVLISAFTWWKALSTVVDTNHLLNSKEISRYDILLDIPRNGCQIKEIVQCLWYCCSVLVILLFSACDIVVQCLWYCCSLLVILLFSACACDIVVQCLWYCCTVLVILLFSACDIVVQCLWYLLFSACDIVVQCLWYCCSVPVILLFSACDIVEKLIHCSDTVSHCQSLSEFVFIE